LGISLGGKKGLSKRPTFVRTERLKPIYYSILFYTTHSITSQTIAAFIFWMNGKSIVLPLHSMEARGGSGDIVPLIINTLEGVWLVLCPSCFPAGADWAPELLRIFWGKKKSRKSLSPVGI
jgi:hypothetical protein